LIRRGLGVVVNKLYGLTGEEIVVVEGKK